MTDAAKDEKRSYVMEFSESAAFDLPLIEKSNHAHQSDPSTPAVHPESFLSTSLDLLDRNCTQEAEELLTNALLAFPGDDRLWMATGICRMRRGAYRAAASAFEMSAWISGDEEARMLSSLCNTSSRAVTLTI